MKNLKKKGYSNYENPKSKQLNNTPVIEGSIITGKLSFYEKLPANVKDHTRESVVMIKSLDGNLCVVYIHGLYDAKGNSRKAKADKGIWLEIAKGGQRVYVDLDLRFVDADGKPIRQGSKFKNTGIILDDGVMEQIRNHIFNTNNRSHSIRKTIYNNNDILAKKSKKKNKVKTLLALRPYIVTTKLRTALV